MIDPDSRCFKLYPYLFSPHFFVSVTMKNLANEEFQKPVISYFKNVAEKSKVKTVQHFTSEGKQKGTIYNIISRYQATKKANYTQITGRPPAVVTPRLGNRMMKTSNKTHLLHRLLLLRSFVVIQKKLHRIKAKNLGFKSYTKQIDTKYIKDQE